MKLTRHNGRVGKHGIYNPKHNDRRFDLENSEHIDSERTVQNIYWNCYSGFDFQKGGDESKTTDLSFDEIEQMYYTEHYTDFVTAQNLRNEKTRHTERNRAVDDLLKNKQTCPEETIYQIGNLEQSVSPETLFQIAYTFFRILGARYGEYYHSLNWALHVDEGTPHIHERHVFDCENKYGEICPQQEKALEKMGIPLPKPDAKRSKNNNRKMMFDAMCRELLMDICENRDLYLDKEPVYGGRQYLEKQDYIIARQKEKVEELTLKLDDVETLLEDVSELAYDKAVEVVTDAVREETRAEDVKIIEDYKSWLMKPERKASPEKRKYATDRLDKLISKIQSATQKAVDKIKKSILNQEVKNKAKAEIIEKARAPITERLARAKKETEKKNLNRRKHEEFTAKQNMEL